ncbi:SUMO1 sentrin specific peptidase 8 [Tilletia horrida]|nr:SUMO1 sentrin specific peptidase 8 [Tilletia horrida]
MSSHWSLLLIYSPPSSSHTTAYHFDSMEPHNAHAAARSNANFASAFDRMPTQIRAVGQGGWSTTSDQGDARAGAVLQSQENAWDCGVYVLALTNGLVHRLSQSSIGGGRDERAQLERVISEVVEANGSPAFIESWRSSFCAWVRKWQEEANGGGGVWDKMEEVVEALGPWAPHE